MHIRPVATTLVGSYPQPEWLIDRARLASRLPPRVPAHELWRVLEPYLGEAQDDATLVAIRDQEHAGVDIVTEGEMARQHFVHGFLEKIEGIDFAHKIEMGIRKDRYKAMVPQVVAPLALKGRVHADEARVAALAARFQGPVVRFGAGAEVSATHVECDAAGAASFELRVDGGGVRVRLPIAGRHILPPLTSEFLNIVKNSSLALTIGLLELTGQSRQIESTTFHGIEAFTAATVIYIVINIIVTFAMRSVEQRVAVPGLIGAKPAVTTH